MVRRVLLYRIDIRNFPTEESRDIDKNKSQFYSTVFSVVGSILTRGPRGNKGQEVCRVCWCCCCCCCCCSCCCCCIKHTPPPKTLPALGCSMRVKMQSTNAEQCGNSMGAALPTQHPTSAATTGSSAPTVLSQQANPVQATPSAVKSDLTDKEREALILADYRDYGCEAVLGRGCSCKQCHP